MIALEPGFFRDTWRREPRLLPGAARDWPERAPGPEALARWATSAEPLGLRVRTDGRTVWFFEGVTDAVPFTDEIVRAARSLFEWDDIWCDLFLTRGPSSVGCHFDNSDNFTIQLHGTKRWRLSPPGTLPADDVRRRMLREPGLGAAPLGRDVREFVVRPGDALYIPNLWVHWGESDGDSASVSVVVNTPTPCALLADGVLAALRHVPAWSEPLPVGPGAARERQQRLDATLDAIFTPDAARRIRPRTGAPMTSPAADRLHVDLDRVRGFLATAPPAPTSGLVLPSEHHVHRTLRALLARRTVRRLLKEIVRRHDAVSAPSVRRLYQRCVLGLLALPDAALEACATEPEITSWVAVAELEVTPDALRAEDPLASALATALAPELTPGDPVRWGVPSDADGAFTVRRLGLRLVPEQPVDELHLEVGDGACLAVSGTRTVPLAEVPGLRVQTLPRLLGVGPHLAPAPSAWVLHQSRSELSTASGDAFTRFVDAMGSGAERLRSAWPDAWVEVSESLRLLVPLPDLGDEPHNFSVHAFRGMVACSPRRDHRAAQSLLHETGHNKLSTLFDLFVTCTNPGEIVRSPVVGADRPLSFVLHGCVAFSQDIALTRRLLDLGPTGSMERYLDATLDKVRAALAVLDRHARLTPVGTTLRDEVAAVVGC